MRLTGQTEGKKAVDLLEEAILLLRRLPLLSWAAIYLGALPFLLVFLLYLLNLAHNPAVSEQLVGYSSLLAVLYVWLKLWQTVFAAEVWRVRAGTRLVTWNSPWVLRIVRDHLRYSAVSLAGLGVSALLVVPLAWSYALHQSLVLAVLPGFRGRDSRGGAWSASWGQARLWPGQNHLVLLLLALISLFAFVNLAACLVFFPYLIKVLTGWESAFTRLGVRLFDLKMFVAALVLTYLAVLPLARTVYVLRCFYGSSLRTGADLMSELRSTKVAAVVLVCLLFAGGSHALASRPTQDTSRAPSITAAPTSPVSADRLDASISKVLQTRKHLWQAPRNVRKSQEPSLWRDVGRAVQQWIEKLVDWVGRVLKWLRPANTPSRRTSGGTSLNVRDVAIGLLIVCAAGLAALVTRALLERRSRSARPITTQVSNPLDLRRAEVSPEELPEEKWLDLAREMMDAGQVRLAVRAIYLAALAVLGKRDLVTLTRFKSNRDYLLELRRRHRGSDRPVTSFQAMVSVFERVWYGRHEPGQGDFEEMHRLLVALKT